MKVGTRVVVHAEWSTFYSQRGVVTSVRPHLMVMLDGQDDVMRFGEREVQAEDEPVRGRVWS